MLAALLAEKGYTGPEHVIDGKEGLVHCFGPEWKLEGPDRRAGRILAYHTMWDEGISHRGADPYPDFGCAGAGEGP
jgi:hypothetical protein